MLCKNTGRENAVFEIGFEPGKARKYNVAPGGTVEIPDGYCEPYLGPTRKTMKPIVEQLHPMMKPLPGEYAPGMSPEFHGLKGVPSAAAAQMDALAKMVRDLTAQVSALQSAKAPVLPAVASSGPFVADDGAVDDVDPDAGEGDDGAFDPDDAEVTTLMKHSKADLMQLAGELGAKVEVRMSKAQIAEAILAARASLEGE